MSTLKIAENFVRWNQGLAGLLLAGSLLAAGPLPLARADEFVDKANKAFAEISQARRSDLVLLPLLAKMAPAPKSAGTLDSARSLIPASSGWAEAKAWAEAGPQKAVLDALPGLVKETDIQKSMVFGQPYGVEGVPIDLVRAKLYTDLGDPATLSGARFLFLPALDAMQNLVHVEAMRRSDAGDTMGGLTVLADFAVFARQIADRQFYKEIDWGVRAITASVERMRDITYLDSKAKQGLSAKASDELPGLIERLDPEKGPLNIARIRLPAGDRIGAEQLMGRVFVNRAGVNTTTFATTMAALGSTDRPLRLFSESAKWQSIIPRQKGWFDMNDELPKPYNDWAGRWDLEAFNRRLDTPSYASTLDRGSYAVLAETLPPIDDLFKLRQVLRTEVAGTRAALGVMGYFYATKSFPPQITSVRPRWVKLFEADPFNPNRGRGAVPPLEYFVPIRDQTFGPREEPKPHTISIFMPDQANFDLKFKQDQFIIYSAGSDGAKNYASKVQNTSARVLGADYLIWPPIKSLFRQYQIDKGDLK